jgi:hypothetical protein
MIPPRSPISMSAVALAEHLGQGPVAGQGQPQAQQVPALCRVGPVAETGPVMKLPVVVDELHVARAESHLQMQRGVIRELSNMSSAAT